MFEEKEIDILELLKKLKNHIILILISTVLLGAIVFGASKFLITPKYEANTSMIVGNSQAEQVQNQQQANVDYNEIQANRALVSTYSEIVKSRGIADRVIENLDLKMDYEDFSKKVSIEPVRDTQIISVKVVDTIPERAMDIANETSEIFKESITKIMNVDNVQILDGASLPDKPSSPKVARNTAIGLVLGLIVGLGIAFLKEIGDTSITSSDEIINEFNIPVLGTVPLMKTDDLKKGAKKWVKIIITAILLPSMNLFVLFVLIFNFQKLIEN